MGRSEVSDCDPNVGFNSLICEDEDQQVSNMMPSKHLRLVAVSFMLLAAALLLVDISLGVHYNKLTDTHLTLDDTQLISSELIKLQDSYKNATENMKVAGKQLDRETSQQTPTNWEFEHETKRSSDYKVRIDQMKKDIATMTSHLAMIDDGCKHCPVGWILMDSACYYFPFSNIDGFKSWDAAREYCQIHGGDLAVIDSKDKENSTVNHLMNNKETVQSMMGFWIGLRDHHEEGTWTWMDGTILVQG
ncbi:hypothetical protein PAMA_003742 [Pampus argenteus]